MNTDFALPSSRYRVTDTIGAGGMGVVYRCADRLSGQTVALKAVNLERATRPNSENLRLAITREFETLATLHHPHVVEVIDYGFGLQQQPYFTMAYLDHARPLDDAAHALALTEQIDLLIQLLQALAYLHRRGVIHHDLKPHNVLVDEHGQVKVLDFGIALLRSSQVRARSSGTLAYLAPENLQGRPVSEVSDLYAFGVLAYELVAGRHPFELHDLRKLLFQIVNEAPDLAPVSDNLRAILAKLLAKDPAARYHDANTVIQDLCAAVGRPLPEENAAIRESFLTAAVFIGRKQELTRLQQGVDQALDGQLSAWLIGGESGVGKSRLLDEIRIYALVKGAQVLRGQAVEGGGLRYQAWRDVLPLLILSTQISDLEASVLHEIVPQIAALIGRPITPAAPISGRGQHQRLSQTICDLFQRQTAPIALLLEDLQWTTESLEILQDLLQISQRLPLFIIGTYRNDDSPHLPEQLAQMQAILLERLSQDEIAELSYGMIGDGSKQPHILEFLAQETEGNPFFLVEVVRALAQDAGRLLNIGTMALPEQVYTGGIQQILQQRIRQVPVWGQAVIQIAAVAGRFLDLTVLKQLLRDHADLLTVPLDTWLTICSDVHVLSAYENRWQFSHDKLREQIIRDLPAEAVPELHAQVAVALETCYPNDSARVEVLMEHWRMAGNVDKELIYLNLAIERLVWNSGQYPQAQTLIERALSLLSKRDPRRVNLFNHLSESYWRMGQFEEAKTYGRRADRLAVRLKVDQDRGRSLGNLGIVARLQGNYVSARKYFLRSLKIRTALNDQLGIARTYANLGIVEFDQGQMARARRYYQRSLKIQRQINDQHGLTLNLLNLGEVCSLEGKPDLANRYVQRCLKMARAVGNRYTIAASLNTLGVASFLAARDAQAVVELEEGLRAFESLRDQYGVAHTLTYLINVMPVDAESYRARLSEGLRLGLAMEQAQFQLRMVVGAARWYAAQHNAAKVVRLGHYLVTKGMEDSLSQPVIQRLLNSLPETIQAELQASGQDDPSLAELTQEVLSDIV